MGVLENDVSSERSDSVACVVSKLVGLLFRFSFFLPFPPHDIAVASQSRSPARETTRFLPSTAIDRCNREARFWEEAFADLENLLYAAAIATGSDPPTTFCTRRTACNDATRDVLSYASSDDKSFFIVRSA